MVSVVRTVTAISALCVILCASQVAMAGEQKSAISRLLREELEEIQKLAGEQAAAPPEYLAWKKGVDEVLQYCAECRYQDAIRLASMPPLPEGNDPSLKQRCDQFMTLLRGAVMYEAGQNDDAVQLLQRLLSQNQESPLPKRRTEIIARRVLAKLMIDRAKFEAARTEVDTALQRIIESGSDTDPDLLAVMIDRVRVLTYMGRLVEARQLCNEIKPQVNDSEEKLPAVYTDYLAVCGFLAYEEHEYSAAVDYMRDAAERNAKTSNPAALDSIEILTNLGLAEAAVGRATEAERHIRKAMAQSQKTFGQHHRFHTRALLALARLSLVKEDYRKGFDYQKQARNATSSSSAFDLAAIQEITANSLFFGEDPAPSRKCYQEAAALYAISGAKLRSIWARCDIARSHYQWDEHQQAADIWGSALGKAWTEKLIASDHPRYLQEMYYFACSLSRLDNYDLAERILAALTKKGAENGRFRNQDLAPILIELGLCQIRLGKYETGEASLERALGMIQGDDEQANRQRAYANAFLVDCYLATSQFERAKTKAAQLDNLIRGSHGEHHPLYAKCALQSAAHLAMVMKDYDTAESLLAKSIAIIEATLGNDAHELESPLRDYESTLRSLGQFDRAGEVADRAERIRTKSSERATASSTATK